MFGCLSIWVLSVGPSYLNWLQTCESYGISDAKDTWHDSETSTLGELRSGWVREMNASNQSQEDEVDLEDPDNLLPEGASITSFGEQELNLRGCICLHLKMKEKY